MTCVFPSSAHEFSVLFPARAAEASPPSVLQRCACVSSPFSAQEHGATPTSSLRYLGDFVAGKHQVKLTPSLELHSRVVLEHFSKPRETPDALIPILTQMLQRSSHLTEEQWEPTGCLFPELLAVQASGASPVESSP